MPPKLPPKKPQSSFVPSPPRKAAAPMPPPITTDTERCVACQGSGTSSRGKDCIPCKGSGRTQVKPPTVRPQIQQSDYVYAWSGAVVAVLALGTCVQDGVYLFVSQTHAHAWMMDRLLEANEIQRNDDGTYHFNGTDYINSKDVLGEWQHHSEPSEYFQIMPLPTTHITK